MDNARRTHTYTAVLCLILALGTLILYLPTVNNGFVNLDDKAYLENPHVADGFDKEDIRWAFTSFEVSNWHPLTWISHLIDVEFFHFDSGSHHFVNILFHIANALLLFLLLSRMTNQIGPSFAVAVLFAVHPAHVESVAWISERKDVLSTFFGLLAIGVYRAWTTQPSARRYISLLVLFACSLMAKPMLVTLPFALLLLDYWPLGRMSGESDRTRRLARLVFEKTPLFILSAAACVVTMHAQSSGYATVSIADLPLTLRIANAALAYTTYLGITFAPLNLAPLYPHPGDALVLPVAFVSLALLAVVTIVAVVIARRAPYALVGWFWFLGTLVPVIGLVQVGSQSMADRYTYVPYIGLFIAIAWGAPALLGGLSEPTRRRTLAVALAVVAVVFSLLTRQQISYWKDSITLFEHTLSVTHRNSPAHLYLGMGYHSDARAKAAKGNSEEAAEQYAKAVSQYTECIRISPRSVDAHVNLGSIVLDRGELDRAKGHFEWAIQLDPNVELAHRNLGNLLFKQDKPAEAVAPLTRALALKPGEAETHFWLALAYEKMGRLDEALEQAEILTGLRPNDNAVKRLMGRLKKEDG